MLYTLSKHIADFLFKQHCFEKELMPLYIYGIQLLLSSVMGVILVLTAGLLTCNLINSILFLLAFIFLRKFTGGLHFNSYITCNTVTVLTFLTSAGLEKLIASWEYSKAAFCFMMVFSITATLVFAPVSNPNKEISDSEKRCFRLISILILFAHFGIFIISTGIISTEIIIVTDFISSAYIIIGLIKNKIERRLDRENQKEHSSVTCKGGKNSRKGCRRKCFLVGNTSASGT